MSLHVAVRGRTVSAAAISAVIIKADGTRIDLGVIASTNRNPVKRALGWLGIQSRLVRRNLATIGLSRTLRGIVRGDLSWT